MPRNFKGEKMDPDFRSIEVQQNTEISKYLLLGYLKANQSEEGSNKSRIYIFDDFSSILSIIKFTERLISN